MLQTPDPPPLPYIKGRLNFLTEDAHKSAEAGKTAINNELENLRANAEKRQAERHHEPAGQIVKELPAEVVAKAVVKHTGDRDAENVGDQGDRDGAAGACTALLGTGWAWRRPCTCWCRRCCRPSAAPGTAVR